MNIQIVHRKTVYRLKVEDNYLGFESHGDDTQILIIDNYEPAQFNSLAGAIDAISDGFYFHHGIRGTMITDETSAKQRMAFIKIEKVIITEECSDIDPSSIPLPTNQQISDFYAAHGDSGFVGFLEPHGCLDPDGYDLVDSNRLQMMGYSEMLKNF